MADPNLGIDGYGQGYSDGSGYGYGSQELSISKDSPWSAYHFIQAQGAELITRSGEKVTVGEPLHEDKIVMCEKGLHASFTAGEARKYAPAGSVLTKVLVWGRVIVDKDKLVATDRQIVEILQ
jgi:hypothetical protein